MKRLLTALAAVVLFALPAHALVGPVSPRGQYVERDITFPNPCLACPGGFTVPDSSVKFFGGTAALDTTAAIPLMGMVNFRSWQSTAVDSVAFMNLTVMPITYTNAATTAADTIYIQAQVSVDGSSWSTVTLTRAFNTSASTRTGEFRLEAGTTNCFVRPYQIATGATAWYQNALVGTAPTEYQWYGWRFVRFIIGFTAGDTGGFKAILGYWADTDLK